MVLRTYFDKTNTVISGSDINTGKNPVSELYYGVNGNGDWTYSRLLLHFNVDRLITQYNDGMLGDLTKVKHILRLVNTGAFHDDLLNKQTNDGKNRTLSFGLVVYELPNADWDEGVGYDYSTGINAVTSIEGSNWFKAKTGSEWSLDNLTLLSDGMHFADGNENLEIDLTDYINGLITGAVNKGIAIAFEPKLEQKPLITHEDPIEEEKLIKEYTKLTKRRLQYVGFFTNNTQTFYEPHIETQYMEYIRDDRRNFYLDKPNKLYLYVNANGEPKNLDVSPTVEIINDMGTTLSGPYIVTHEKKGVYSVEIELNLPNFRGPAYYSDLWSNIFIDGKPMGDVQMGFEIQNGNTFYDIGMGVERPKDYKVVISGIRHGESIKRGDVRRILTNAMIPYTVDQKVLLDGINYRLYVKEGNIEHTVIDYEPVERSYKDNYILLDTMSLLPNVYYLDIQMISNQEIKTTKDVISFQIVA